MSKRWHHKHKHVGFSTLIPESLGIDIHLKPLVSS